jgi:hypothetical protein
MTEGEGTSDRIFKPRRHGGRKWEKNWQNERRRLFNDFWYSYVIRAEAESNFIWHIYYQRRNLACFCAKVGKSSLTGFGLHVRTETETRVQFGPTHCDQHSSPTAFT